LTDPEIQDPGFTSSGRPLPMAVVREGSWLRRRARRLLGGSPRTQADSMDYAQEAQGRALEHLEGSFPNRHAFRAWLEKILQRLIAGDARQRALRPAAVDLGSGLVGAQLTPGSKVARSDEQRLQERALRRLAPRQQQIVRLRIWEGLKFGEIGRRLDISENNARQLFHRTVQQLQREFGGEV
jgi:RNA polymerase sigma factor (sigma-70 family)